MMPPTLRQKLGTLLLDRPRAAWPVLFPRLAILRKKSWLDLHNRDERLIQSHSGVGYDCDWQWTSDLNLCRVFPWFGNRLVRTALADWPICFAESLSAKVSGPLVSFIIGHRGTDKIPHLQATLRTILGQQQANVECIVVEQATESVLTGQLPKDVRLIQSRPPFAEMPYARAWAFNLGARCATGDVLVFHDNDILAPAYYAREIIAKVGEQSQAVRLQRFVFYLNRSDTMNTFDTGQIPERAEPEFVRQNCEGHTLAVEQRAYFDMGGHDESFIGWGGEDNEMFDRCRAIGCDPFGYLPFVHLYHPPQARPANPEIFQAKLRQRLSTPPQVRIRELAARPFGELSGPYILTENLMA